MATIFPRLNKSMPTTWRVVVRRKYTPLLCLSFSSVKEAEEWVKNNEWKYMENPVPYLEKVNRERLRERRKRALGIVNLSST